MFLGLYLSLWVWQLTEGTWQDEELWKGEEEGMEKEEKMWQKREEGLLTQGQWMWEEKATLWEEKDDVWELSEKIPSSEHVDCLSDEECDEEAELYITREKRSFYK